LEVPKYILPNFGSFYKYIIWHHIIKLHKVSGLQMVALDAPSRVRKDDVRLAR